jgi:integrase
MAAVYKVGKKWRADWTDSEGIRHRKRFKTKGDADEHLTEIKSQIKDGTYVAPQKIVTFGELADAWVAGRIEQSRTPGAGYRPSTLAQWQSHVAHLKFSFENYKVNVIDAAALESAAAQWRLPKDQGGRGLGAKTCRKVLTTAARIFKYGMRNKRGVQANPVALIEKTKESSGEEIDNVGQANARMHEVTEREVLTPTESKALILATSPGVYRTLIAAAIHTGARISELLALRWSDLQLDKATVAIRRTVSTARVKGEANQEKWRWFSPKTDKGFREIPIPSSLVAALKEWREKCPQSQFELVFCREDGTPLDRTGVGREVLAPAVKQAQIEKKITPHSLRHTYASTLIMLGRDIPQVSKYLGHSDVYITLKVYTHFVPRKLDTMDDLEKLIQNS